MYSMIFHIFFPAQRCDPLCSNKMGGDLERQVVGVRGKDMLLPVFFFFVPFLPVSLLDSSGSLPIQNNFADAQVK